MACSRILPGGGSSTGLTACLCPARSFRKRAGRTAIERQYFLEELAFSQDGGCALEPVAFAADRIDDVDLDCRVGPQVADSSRGSDVGEARCSSSQIMVVPLARGRGCRRAHGGDERKPLFANDTLHILSQN